MKAPDLCESAVEVLASSIGDEDLRVYLCNQDSLLVLVANNFETVQDILEYIEAGFDRDKEAEAESQVWSMNIEPGEA